MLSVDCLLRGAELAQQQRADVAFSICACNAAIVAIAGPRSHAVPASLAEQALAVASEAEAATKRARRLLPASWVEPMQPLLQAVQHMLAAASGRQMPSGEALRQDVRAIMQGVRRAPNCAGCGKWAAGLRRCSRCKAVSYCRWVLAGWVLPPLALPIVTGAASSGAAAANAAGDASGDAACLEGKRLPPTNLPHHPSFLQHGVPAHALECAQAELQARPMTAHTLMQRSIQQCIGWQEQPPAASGGWVLMRQQRGQPSPSKQCPLVSPMS